MQKTICALGNQYGWGNQQLTKNCGLVPYLFQQLYGWRAIMAGTRSGRAYPGAAYIPGVQLVPFADDTPETAVAYIRAQAAHIDVLVLHGAFPYYFAPLHCYKQLQPQGKVYLELDPNIFYQDQLVWTEPDFRQFLQDCDVIGASGHSMQRYLSAKWPCVVEYLPNGFYDLSGTYQPLTAQDFARKENIILTVGRIGTEQKNNECLLEAFLQVADAYPDWRLVMVGPVVPAFQARVAQLWQENPALRERIFLPGPIADKATLFALYRRASIFALTSRMEGGTPNVVAEALMHGCCLVVSNFDAADDAIDGGRCGCKFSLAVSGALAQGLRELLGQPAAIAAACRQAQAYGERNFDFVKITQRLYYLLQQGGADDEQ